MLYQKEKKKRKLLDDKKVNMNKIDLRVLVLGTTKGLRSDQASCTVECVPCSPAKC